MKQVLFAGSLSFAARELCARALLRISDRLICDLAGVVGPWRLGPRQRGYCTKVEGNMATPPLQPVGAPARFRNIEVIVIPVLCLVLPTGSVVYMSQLWGWFVVALSRRRPAEALCSGCVTPLHMADCHEFAQTQSEYILVCAGTAGTARHHRRCATHGVGGRSCRPDSIQGKDRCRKWKILFWLMLLIALILLLLWILK